MKHIIPIIAGLFLLPCAVQAQAANPFKSIGKKTKMLTLSNGRYQETFDDDVLQRVGTVMIDRRTKKIVKMLDADSVNNVSSDNSSASRWYSTDPLAAKYPNISPYAFCANNPVLNVDPDGREIWVSHQIFNKNQDPVIVLVQYKNGGLLNKDGTQYQGNDAYVLGKMNELNTLKQTTQTANFRISYLEGVTNKHLITNYDPVYKDANNYNREGKQGSEYRSITIMDPAPKENSKYKNELVNDPVVTLAHEEAGHAYDRETGLIKQNATQRMYPGANTSCEEVEAVKVENEVRENRGYAPRTQYSGETIPKQSLQECP